MHTFTLGPSGAGKSYLSKQLARKDALLLIEADLWPAVDGMVHHNLKPQWDCFYNNFDPTPLRSELDSRAEAAGKSGTVVSFPGFPLLREKHITVARGFFRIVYFAGSPDQCRDSFLERERITGRGLTISYWKKHVGEFFKFLDSGEVATNTISTFKPDGTKRSFEDIYHEIHEIA